MTFLLSVLRYACAVSWLVVASSCGRMSSCFDSVRSGEGSRRAVMLTLSRPFTSTVLSTSIGPLLTLTVLVLLPPPFPPPDMGLLPKRDTIVCARRGNVHVGYGCPWWWASWVSHAKWRTPPRKRRARVRTTSCAARRTPHACCTCSDR